MPLSDSPWFWVLVFSLFGAGALLAMHGKYGRRQAGIDRKSEVRQRWQQGDLVVESAPTDGSNAATEQMPRAPSIPLWPLAVVLGLLSVLSFIMLMRERKATPLDVESQQPT